MPATREIEHPAFREAMADLAAFGVVEDDRAGEPFGVISGRSSARWWLSPLNDRRQAASGLDLYRPVSAPASALKAAARAGCRIGLQRLALGGALRLSGVGEFAGSFPGGATTCAIFTGTDSPHRKTAVQFMDSSGRILGYGKISRNPAVIPWIEKEAVRLQEVAALRLTSAETPRLLGLRRQGGAVLMLTDGRKNRGFANSRTLLPSHRAFLSELASRTAGGNWRIHVDGMREKLARVETMMGAEWRRRIGRSLDLLAKGPELPLVLAHGDFTPWNSFLGGPLYVFDWEYAGRRAAGHDAIHFTVAARPLVRGTPLIRSALDAASGHVSAMIAGGPIQALLAYLCSQTLLFAQREAEGSGRQDSWDGADRMAEAIDNAIGLAGLASAS